MSSVPLPPQHLRDLVREHLPPAEPATRWPLVMDTLGEVERAAAIEVLLQPQLTMGPRTAAFEAAWSAALGVPASVMVNSGSSANLLALTALTRIDDDRRLRPGDEVILPAVTWSTTLFPIHQVGCVPVLVDIDPLTLNLDPKAVAEAITPRTRAIMAVHTLGTPCDMSALQALAERHDLWVIEDCCEAHGARWNDRPVGTLGDVATFSFFFSHHMTTIEGGMISVAHRPGLVDALRSLRAHGWTRERSDRAELARAAGVSDDRWLFVSPGYNLRPTEIQAAIGHQQLQRLPDFIAQRRATFTALRAALEPWSALVRTQQPPANGWASPFSCALVVTPEAPFHRDALRDHFEAQGIETRPIVGGNLARQPVTATIAVRQPGPLNTADAIHDNGFMIGINPGIRPEQIAFVVDTLAAFVNCTLTAPMEPA